MTTKIKNKKECSSHTGRLCGDFTVFCCAWHCPCDLQAIKQTPPPSYHQRGPLARAAEAGRWQAPAVLTVSRCVLWCLARSLELLKAFWQPGCWHRYGFSPVWLRKWILRFSSLEKAFLHPSNCAKKTSFSDWEGPRMPETRGEKQPLVCTSLTERWNSIQTVANTAAKNTHMFMWIASFPQHIHATFHTRFWSQTGFCDYLCQRQLTESHLAQSIET